MQKQPSENLNMFIERNLTFVTIYIYAGIAIIINLLSATLSKMLPLWQRIVSFILINATNIGLYIVSKNLYMKQIDTPITKETQILLNNSIPYMIGISVITFVLATITLFIVPKLFKLVLKIIGKQQEIINDFKAEAKNKEKSN